MGRDDDRPAWQVEECPAWCVVLHTTDDHESDRRHVSASLSVPVRELRPADAAPPVVGEPDLSGPDDGPGDRTVATELAVCLQRRDGGPTTWVYVGDGTHQALELSADSWHRLLPALDRVLDLARG